MAAPIVYRWDDANAPVLHGGDRKQLINLLKKCLVDGYGTKAAAGWTMPFINATLDKACFRSNPTGGNGFYLQVDQMSAAYTSSVKLQAFETMTSESAGLNQFIPAGSITDVSGLSYTQNTAARPWLLIADDKFLYFYVWYTQSIPFTPSKTTVAVWSFCFGDGIKRSADDNYFSFINVGFAGSGGAPGSPSDRGTAEASGYNALYTPRKRNGVYGPFGPVVVANGGPYPQYPGYFSSGNYEPYVVGGEALFMRPYVNNAEAFTFRGYVPGWYHSCHNQAFDPMATITIGGKNFLSIYASVSGTGAACNLIISLDDWRA